MTRQLIAEFAVMAKEPRAVGGLDELSDLEPGGACPGRRGLSNDEIAARLVATVHESGRVRPGWLG